MPKGEFYFYGRGKNGKLISGYVRQAKEEKEPFDWLGWGVTTACLLGAVAGAVALYKPGWMR